MFDILSLCETSKKDGSKDHLSVDPGIVYPAVVERIADVLSGSEAPKELLPKDFKGNPWYAPGIEDFLSPARELPAEAWTLVLTPKADVSKGSLKVRALALAFVERYAKRAIAMADGMPEQTSFVHILKDERFAQ